MRKLLFILTILIGNFVFAQENPISSEKFQVGIQYNQFFDKADAVSINYNGILGINSRYKVASFGVVDFNVGLTLGYFESRYKNEVEEYTGAFNWNPNVAFEFNTNSGFKPFVAVGYNFFNSNYKIYQEDLNFPNPNDPAFQGGGDDSWKVRLSGFNANIGTRYHFKKWFYMELSYNLMVVKTSGHNFGLEAVKEFNSFYDFSYYTTEKNTNLHLFNIGVGLRF